MVKAFVFGKFLPFHQGHKAMIDFALSKCDILSVLICCSDKESTTGQIRKKWIEDSFKNRSSIEVDLFDYQESELPNTSESSQEVSKIWSIHFKKIYPNASIVVTSEPYGNFVAQFMGIKHISFDLDRTKHQVSATSIQNDLFKYWNFLPPSVKVSFAIKVVLHGTESTGKSTLSKLLSSHFNCNMVEEVGRELIPDSKSFQFEDLMLVANEHAKRIKQGIVGKSPLTIIDTNIYTTISYASHIFDTDLSVGEDIFNANQADLHLYLDKEVTYFQDGTRLPIEERDLLDQSHRNTLKKFNIKFVEISGNWKERFNLAVTEIETLLKTKAQLHL